MLKPAIMAMAPWFLQRNRAPFLLAKRIREVTAMIAQVSAKPTTELTSAKGLQ
jgi:hypothetical protein